jgi:hypothetical protein
MLMLPEVGVRGSMQLPRAGQLPLDVERFLLCSVSRLS